MQYLYKFRLGLVAAALFAFGCSSKNAAVEGTTWRSVGRTAEGRFRGMDHMEIEFLDNHNVEFRTRFTGEKSRGTYSASGNKLTMRLVDEETRRSLNFEKVVIDGDQMTLQDPEGGELLFEKVK